jgi:hypothetical protein
MESCVLAVQRAQNAHTGTIREKTRRLRQSAASAAMLRSPLRLPACAPLQAPCSSLFLRKFLRCAARCSAHSKRRFPRRRLCWVSCSHILLGWAAAGRALPSRSTGTAKFRLKAARRSSIPTLSSITARQKAVLSWTTPRKPSQPCRASSCKGLPKARDSMRFSGSQMRPWWCAESSASGYDYSIA